MSLNGTSSIMTFEPFSAPQRTGAIVVAVFALLSTLALAFMALRTIRLVLLQRDNSTHRSPETLFFRTQLGHYTGCLILSNMFISVAGLIDFSWVSHSGLSQGSTCSAQAVLMQIGIWGTCWFTVALGVHNLTSFVFRIHQSRWHSLVAVTIGWAIAFVAGLVPLQRSEAYGPTGLSCGITRSYPTDIFALEVIPIILTTFVSIAVYSVIFIVLYWELSMNNIRKLGGRNSTNQREDKVEERHGFIRMIIWTMFWFPLAFVFLSLPFCVTHILVYAGYSVPSAPSAFADVCVSTLGFVNVCLLCNTLRVIRPMSRGPRSDEDTVKTFGHDASFESPITPQNKPFSQSPVLSHEKGHRTHNSTHPSSNHSRDSSWASADSNTGLLGAQKASVQAKVALPPWLGNAPSRTASLGPHSPRVPFVTRDARPGPLTQDQQCSSQPMTDTNTSRKSAKVLSFKSKAPPALELSPLPVSAHTLSARGVANKSATLAARLGIPVASARTPSQLTAVDRENAGAPVLPVIPIPRIEVNTWSPEKADKSSTQSSPSFSLSFDSDCDPEDLGEIMYVRPLPESGVNEQDPHPASSQCMHARSQRATMVSVWSQESGYTMSQPPDTDAQEAYQRLVANLLDPRAIQGNQAGVGGVMKRQTPSGPRARPETLLKSTKKLSVHSSQMLSPESDSTIVIAPNDSIV